MEINKDLNSNTKKNEPTPPIRSVSGQNEEDERIGMLIASNASLFMKSGPFSPIGRLTELLSLSDTKKKAKTGEKSDATG